MIDPKLGPLLVSYVRGSDGAAEVLQDAFLERGLTPLRHDDDRMFRFELAFSLLSPKEQLTVGCASTRRVMDRFTKEVADNAALANGLLALERSILPGADAELLSNEVRHAVFNAWLECDKKKRSQAAKRAAWAVWMLMRQMPLVALRTVRAIDAAELEAQIDLMARALGA